MESIREYVGDRISDWLDPPTDKQRLRRMRTKLKRQIGEMLKREEDARRREEAKVATLRDVASRGDEVALRDAAVTAAKLRGIRISAERYRRAVEGAEARLVAAESSGLVREAMEIANGAMGIATRGGATAISRQVQAFQRTAMAAEMAQDAMDTLIVDEEEPDVDEMVTQLLEGVRLGVMSDMPSISVSVMPPVPTGIPDIKNTHR